MIDVKCKVSTSTQNVGKAIDKAAYRNFGHAAASIRKAARDSIQKAPKEERRGARRRKGKAVRRATRAASPPGSPPFTGRGQIKRATVFDADKEGAVIGPRYSVLGTSAAAHEHGGEYRGANYPKRSFMLPAMEANLSRFAASWEGSIFGG